MYICKYIYTYYYILLLHILCFFLWIFDITSGECLSAPVQAFSRLGVSQGSSYFVNLRETKRLITPMGFLALY